MRRGMVGAPDAFLEEIGQLAASGVDFAGRLFVSNRAHVLFPLHAALDRAREEARGGNRIGTTSRGIGPAYARKASRYGLLTCDLAAPHLAAPAPLPRRPDPTPAFGSGPARDRGHHPPRSAPAAADGGTRPPPTTPSAPSAATPPPSPSCTPRTTSAGSRSASAAAATARWCATC